MRRKLDERLKLSIRSSHTGSILSHLYRLILRDKGLLEKYEDVISKYIIRNKGTSTKGKTEHNIKKDILSDTLSFDNFIYLLRETLLVKRFRITIELDYGDAQREEDIEVHRTQFFSLSKFKKGEKNNESREDRENKGTSNGSR
jgi:hypothetical protein